MQRKRFQRCGRIIEALLLMPYALKRQFVQPERQYLSWTATSCFRRERPGLACLIAFRFLASSVVHECLFNSVLDDRPSRQAITPMTVPKLPAVSFADETGYDSDEFENDTFSNASSSSSGVILGFDDGELAQVASQEQQQQQTDSNAIAYEDEANLTISRIGGRSVSLLSSKSEAFQESKLIRIFGFWLHIQW